MQKRGKTGRLMLPLGLELKLKWDDVCDPLGLPQTEAGRRLIRWFVAQPVEDRLRVLGMLPVARRRTKRAKGG